MKKIQLAMISAACVVFVTYGGATAQPKVVVTDMPRTLNDGLNNLGEQIAQGLTENQKRRIAVVEFVDLKGNVSDLGRYLSEKLITRLFQSKRFTVIERQQLNKIIAEQKLSLTGIIDPSSAQKLGKLLGVDAIATGSVTNLGKTVEINARLISTETGEVFSAASVSITKDESVCNLISCGDTVKIDQSRPGSTTELQKSSIGGPLPINQPVSKPIRKDLNGFTFELTGCGWSGRLVVCELFITNNASDQNVSIRSDYTLFFDESGNESRMPISPRIGGSDNPYMVNGVVMKARLSFPGVASEAKKASLLKLAIQPMLGSYFYLEFRSVLIIGKSD